MKTLKKQREKTNEKEKCLHTTLVRYKWEKCDNKNFIDNVFFRLLYTRMKSVSCKWMYINNIE